MNFFKGLFFLFAFSLAANAIAGLNDGLVLHYTFDAAPSAGLIADQTALHNDGTVVGSPALVPGRCDGAWSFNGTNDYIWRLGNASLDVGTQFTCSIWYNAATYGVQRPLMEWCLTAAGYGHDYGAHLWCNVHGGNWVGTGANLVTTWGSISHIISVPDLSLNAWHHMVVTFSKATGVALLYLDGSVVSSNRFGSISPLTAADFYIGRRLSVPTAFWHGLLDDARVYNRVLGPEEVAALYKGWPSVYPPCITFIGFSTAPDGDQDVTEFFTDETLFIKVRDVSLDPARNPRTRVYVRVLVQSSKSKTLFVDLVRQADGFFTGSVPLNALKAGPATLTVREFLPDRVLIKDTDIMLYAPAIVL